MNRPFSHRTDLRQALLIRQGLEWYRTYGQRSAYAYLLHREVPRERIDRIFSESRRRDDQAATSTAST